MITIIRNFLRRNAKPSSAFSNFFMESPSSEKRKVFKQVIRAANEDQKALIERYKRLYGNS